ncbi:TonB-linked outer membrane protein, SusC/RagA family [Pustulibacterium marinum]|uniref:TonB-linked outer membrane protein, SusC/RagA family n=1 Tax=Pustulibacterium marinum TaxID=1224947 RepID=A0A1I7IAL7_9FLAO|nr:TonB-dependent receptor [Pustulibacterium marinum]SFU69979.1 TonB-linked outer membrane protein, SusC/RagA family [Pustulibacterium marinum]
MEKLKFVLLVCILAVTGSVWSQTTVNGVVADGGGIPIPGANVVIKGSTSGTATDFDGKFTITASKGDVLVFSFIGFQSKEITFENQTTLNVTLQENSAQLDEVVVIGYGTVKRKDVTGSVATVDSKKIEQANKVDAVSALQGQAPGVVIQRTDNKPGSGGFNIRIRGASTINTNETASNGGFNPGQNPLFIVDGIFVDDISFLNPADISRMDILKDASATAVYGSRGSNGVVLIETKSGRNGKMRVDYSNYFGFKEAYHLPSIQDGPGYVEYLKDVVVGNEFAAGNLDYTRDDVVLSDYLDAEELQNVADGVNTDWVGLLLKKGFQTNHTLNLSGGSEKTTYAAGLGYTRDVGNMEGEDFSRYNIRASVNSDLAEWVNFSLSNYLTYAVQNTGSWEAFRSAYRLKPIGRAYNEDGTLKFFPTAKETQVTNPLFEADNVTRETRYLQYIGDIALKLTPIKNVTFTTKFSPNIKFGRYGEYRGLYSKSVVADPANRRAQVENTNYFSYAWDNIINYNFEKGVHTVDFTGVFSRYLERSEGYYTQVRNFTTDEFSFYNLGAGTDIRDVSSDFSKLTLESYTGRINYGLLDKYLITLTGRYDGASILADGNKWAFFPSAAFAWKIMEEDFMKSQKVLTNAKLRLSYGQTGNNGQGGGLAPLGSQSLLGSSATTLGDQSYSTLYVTALANKNLKWERTSEINIGIDFGFLNNRINGSIDVYNRKNTDIIFNTGLSTVTGFSGVYENIGESTNRGIEIGLNTINIDKGDFTWSTNINFASNRNRLEKLYGGVDEIIFNVQGTNLIQRVGEPVGAIYDYEYIGTWQIDEAAEAAQYGQTPGQVKVRDVNNDGQITADADRKVIGQVTPKWTGGITNNFKYKNLDFSFFLNVSQGNKILSNFHNNFSFPWDGDPTRLFNAYDVDYWTPTNPTNDWYQPGNGGIYQNAVKYKDISFVKVGYMTLGYTFADNVLEKLKMSSLRVYSTVQNPFTFTKYDGWDPENAGRNAWGAAFMSRTYMLGLNVSF